MRWLAGFHISRAWETVYADDSGARRTEEMWVRVAVDLERLATANQNLNRTCEELRLELDEARQHIQSLKKQLDDRKEKRR